MKKYLIMITAALIVLSGCSGSSQTRETSNDSEDIIKMGYYGPLTGPASLYGQAARNGAALAIEEINDNGGVDGKKIELVEMDDKSSPEQAVKAVTRLVGVKKVDVIIGSHISGNILASAPIVEKAKIPEIGNGTSPSWLQKGYKYLFRSLPNSSWNNKGLLNAVKEVKVQKIGVLYRKDEYGKTGADDFIKKLEDSGIEVMGVESYQPGDTDFTGQYTKLLNEGVESVALFSVAEDLGNQLKQLRKLNFDGYVFGLEGLAFSDVLEIAGDTANKAIFSAAYVIPKEPKEAQTEAEKEFLKSYVKKYGKMPIGDNAYRTYDAVKIFELAIKNAKSLEGEKIRDAIENITDYEGLAGSFNYKGNNGEGIHSIRTFIINDGKFELLEDYLKDNQ